MGVIGQRPREVGTRRETGTQKEEGVYRQRMGSPRERDKTTGTQRGKRKCTEEQGQCQKKTQRQTMQVYKEGFGDRVGERSGR